MPFWRCLLLLTAATSFAQQLEFQFVPRPLIEERLRSYTIKNSEREPGLRKLFEDAGCKGDNLAEQTVKSQKQPNLVCTLPGASESTIVVGAHFDLAERGQGVVDNWSGASLLPSLYQALSGSKPQHTFVFVGFMGEEKGLIGSQAFVKQLGKNPETRVRAMVNLDTLGLADTEVWVSHADKELVDWMWKAAAATNLPIAPMNVERVGSTDSESFREKKIPAITIHSLTNETWPILHSVKDRIDAIHLEEYYRTYKLMSAYLVVLDQKLTADNVDHAK